VMVGTIHQDPVKLDIFVFPTSRKTQKKDKVNLD